MVEKNICRKQQEKADLGTLMDVVHALLPGFNGFGALTNLLSQMPIYRGK